MAGPTLIAAYAIHSAGADASDLVTPSFNPVNGEVIVAKLITWDTNNPMGALSGGGQTYQNRVTAQPGGFNGYSRLDTAVITGSPGAMTITGAGTASASRHSMIVERWGNAKLAASPAVNAVVNDLSSAPAANITTAADNSALSWALSDALSNDPATRAYRLSGIEDGLWDGHIGSNGVFYSAFTQNVGPAGTYTIGMTAPGGQRWAMVGIEIQESATQVPTGALAMFL